MAVPLRYRVKQKADSAMKVAIGESKLFGKKKRLRVSVYNTRHGKQSDYSHFKGTNYQLASIMINGRYKGGIQRPFMFAAMERMKNDEAFLKDFRRFVFADKGDNKIKVDWQAAALMTKVYVRETLARNELGLEPLAEKSLEDRYKAGHSGDTPLFASGKLCDAITCKAESV